MNIFPPDWSVFDINNPYPERYQLNDHAEILVFDDFLKKPDEYKEIISSIPAFRSDFFYPTASPGWRQLIPVEFTDRIEDVLGNILGYSQWVEQAFTNIYKSNMPCNCKSWYPHYDSMRHTFNLWLSSGPGGTAFYTWNGHYNGDEFGDELEDLVFANQIEGDFQYQEFLGDSQWEMYHLESIKYNRAILYNGHDFHSAYVPNGSFLNDWRYSLVLMGG
jgi:hypothetical protein